MQYVGNRNTPSADLWSSIRRDFHVGEIISEGRGVALIRRAQEGSTGKEVALKINSAILEEYRLRARKEAEIAATAAHPNIIECYAVYESQTEVVLVLEYCRDGDLLDRVNSHGCCGERETRRLFKQVVLALDHFYQSGFAHRDVKLDNIFIQRDSCTQAEVLKLADFGFADQYQGAKVHYKHSCGSLAYAAPELLVPQSQVDYDGEPADVWSAGVVLYALLCGTLPFHSGLDGGLVQKIRLGSFEMPTNISPSLRDLLASMLNVDPTQRPLFSALSRCEWICTGEAKENRIPNHNLLKRLTTRLHPKRGTSS